MKTLFSFGMAAFVLGFIFSADIDATETWEKEFTAKGWVKVRQKLMDQANTTWCGTKFRSSGFLSYEGWVFYIDPSGKNIFMKIIGTSLSDTRIREETKDGICIVWKQGGRYLHKVWKKRQAVSNLPGEQPRAEMPLTEGDHRHEEADHRGGYWVKRCF